MTGIVLYPERDCSTCAAVNKPRWGCESDISIPIIINGENHFRCPLRPLLEEPAWVQRVLFFYSFYKDQQYPDPGTFYDQSSRYLMLMQVVENAFYNAREVKKK